jgi:ABC-2 type transport system permease protein
MRQTLQMFWIDVRLSFKSYMGVFMLVVPLLILLVLRFFLPSVENAGVTFAVVTAGPNAVEASLVEELDRYGTVWEYETVEAMEQRLRGAGEAEGLYRDPARDQYVSVLERSVESNTVFSAASRIIRQAFLAENYPSAEPIIRFRSYVPDELADRTLNPPVATVGGAIYIVYLTILTAFMIGLGVVNDKEYGTDRAYRVSPVSRTDYFVGKSLFPFIVLLVYSGVGLLVLGLTDTNVAQVYVGVVLSFGVSLLIALFVGALTKNENEAIGVIKMLGMVMGLGILAGTLLPDSWQWVAWWIPFYWLYTLLEGVFTLSETWVSVGWKSAIIAGSTFVYFMLARRRIVEGLS